MAKVNRDEALERSPQYRHMVNLENRERKKQEKKRHQRGGKKIGKKHPDGTYTEVSTTDCDWHERWQNPDMEAIIEHAKKSGNDKKFGDVNNKQLAFKQA
jgi:hypothetical protein|tara:strand:+ start:61 stop:360 length:300 start_codon:yes stop_codon:yes gene_type:complete